MSRAAIPCAATALLVAGVLAGWPGGGARADLALGDPATEPEVRALLTEWLASQNHGSFDRYSAFYATGFTGVRRSTSRTVELDRDGWLTDRKRMFRKPMVVDAKDVHVTAGTSPVLRFLQTFRSGNYADEGEKRMQLVNEDGKLRIAREELLVSRPLGSSPSPASPAGRSPEAPAGAEAPAPPAARPPARYFPIVAGEPGDAAHAQAALDRFQKEADMLAPLRLEPGSPTVAEARPGGPQRAVIGYCSTDRELDKLESWWKAAFPYLHVERTPSVATEESCPEPVQADYEYEVPATVTTAQGTLTALTVEEFVCCDCGYDDDDYRWTLVVARDTRGTLRGVHRVADRLQNMVHRRYKECRTAATATDDGAIELWQRCEARRRVRMEFGSREETTIVSDHTWTVSLVGGKLSVRKKK